MAYFNWCVQNHIESISIELLVSMLGEESKENAKLYEGSLMTKESLEMANSLLMLNLIN